METQQTTNTYKIEGRNNLTALELLGMLEDSDTQTDWVVTPNPDEYNGYTNRETWAFMLHIGNDEGLYSDVYGRAEEIIEDAEPSKYLTAQEEAEREIEEMLKDWYDQVENDTFNSGDVYNLPSMVQDVGSEWRINYRECAKNIMEDLQE